MAWRSYQNRRAARISLEHGCTMMQKKHQEPQSLLHAGRWLQKRRAVFESRNEGLSGRYTTFDSQRHLIGSYSKIGMHEICTVLLFC